MRDPDHITNESLGQPRGYDDLADDNLRGTPEAPILKDRLDPGTLADLAQVSGHADAQPLVPDRNYAYQHMSGAAAAVQTKPYPVTGELGDPNEVVHPEEWSPAADRALCEGRPVAGLDQDDVSLEVQPYPTVGEERANGEWAERMRTTERAVALHATHSAIATTDDTPTDDATTRGPTTDAGDATGDGLTRTVEQAAGIADLAATLECSLETARGQLEALKSMGERLDASGANTGAGAPDEDEAASEEYDPLLGHREAYCREALRHREPVRQATDDFAAPATTVGHGHRDPAATSEPTTSFVNVDDIALDEARHAEVAAAAADLHDRYPSLSTDLAEKLLLQELDGGASMTDAVLAVSDPETVRAHTGVTPIGALDPESAPTPREEPQATVRGEITELYDPADRSQQQVGIIEDPTGAAKVTIWAASEPTEVLREGDTVQIVNAVVGQYRGQPTLAVVGEQSHLPPYKRSHEPTDLLVFERGDGPARTYTPDWHQEPADNADARAEPEQAAPDPRASLSQATLGAVNEAAIRLAELVDGSQAGLSRALAERVTAGLSPQDAVHDLVGEAVAAVEGDQGAHSDEVVPVPRATPPERWDGPVEQPDTATRQDLGPGALAAGEWLYADEEYPDEWPIYRRHYEYGQLVGVERVGILRLDSDQDQLTRDRPPAPSMDEVTDDDAALTTTSAVCPQCSDTVDANVRIMQTRAADEAGTRLYVGECGHRWRGDD